MAKLNRIILTVLILGFLAGAVNAATYFVNCDTGVNTTEGAYGTSEAFPWKNITYAATMSAISDTIYVAAGTYNTATGESFPITITGRYFISANTLLATIDAGSANALTLGAGATLEGFTVKSTTTDKVINITGANANVVNNNLTTSYSVTSGDDIYIQDAGDYSTIQGNAVDSRRSNSLYFTTGADFPTISSNTLINTQSYQAGININAFTTRVSIEGNTITADKGVYFAGTCSNLNVRNNTVIGFSTDTSSIFGIYVRGAGSIISNEVRSYRTGDYSNWGAIRVYDGTVTVKNNTLVRNLVGINNGGTATITNNIVSAGPGPGISEPGSVGIRNTGTTTSNYNQLYNNEQNYMGTVLDKTQDLTTCPRFVNIGSHDYRLFSDSPCVNSADDGGNRGRYGSVEATSGILAASYVSVSGDNNNTGTDEANAWRTVTRAISSTESTINVLAGTYTAGEVYPLTMSIGQYLRSIASPTTLATLDAGASTLINLPAQTTLEGFSLRSINNVSNDTGFVIGVIGPNVYILNNNLTTSYSYNSGYSDIKVLDAGDYTTVQGNVIDSRRTYTLNFVSNADYPTIRNNTLTNTQAYRTAVNINWYTTIITVEGNTITADDGIHLGGPCSNINIQNNKIIAYSTDANSIIGIYSRGTGTIASNEVRGYRTGDYNNWGAIRVYDGTVTIKNNTLARNLIGINNGGTATIVNNIISAAPQLGSFEAGSIGIRSAGTTTTRYNDLFNNNTSYYGSGFTSANDITTSPRFVNPPAHDYRLFSDSPCAPGATSTEAIGRYGAIASLSGITSESYVDDDAPNEDGDGSLANPWKTIKHALSSTEGTVNVRAGTYNAVLGEIFPLNVSPYNILRNYLTEVATIDAGNANTVMLAGNYATIEGLVIKGIPSSKYGIEAYIGADIKNNRLEAAADQSSAYGIYLKGNNIRSSGNTIILLSSGSSYGIASIADLNNIYISSNNIKGGLSSIYLLSNNDNAIIMNNVATAERQGVQTGGFCDNLRIESNTLEVTDNYTGIELGDQNQNFVIKGNLIKGPAGGLGTCGINIYRAGGTIEANEIRGFQRGGYGYGINAYAYGGTLFVKNNTIIKSRIGIIAGVYSGNGAVIAKNNIIAAAPALGTFLEGSYGIYYSDGTFSESYNCVFNCSYNYYNVTPAVTDIIAYPRFVGPAANDYRLFSDSPCAGTADDGGNRGAYGTVEATSGITSESYVDDDAPDEGGDGSLGDPWKTITHALSSTEGTINVREGTYNVALEGEFPLIVSANNIVKNYLSEVATVDAQNTNTVFTAGSYATIEGLRIMNPISNKYGVEANIGSDIKNNYIETAASQTTVYGIYLKDSNVRLSNNIIRTLSSGSSYGIGSKDSINGATIMNNDLSGGANEAIRLGNYNDYFTLMNNTISSQRAPIYTGGWCDYLTIENNTLEVTTAGYAGIQFGDQNQSFIIKGNLVKGPAGGGGRWGIQIYRASGTIEANEVRGFGEAGSYGYGIDAYAYGGTLYVLNNTVIKSRIGIGGGVYSGNGSVVSKNNIVSSKPDGTAPIATSIGIYNYGGTMTSTYDDSWNNVTNWSPSLLSGEGTKSADPKFADVAGDDYHLASGSPCIAAGTPEGTDMGAYDYTGPSITLKIPNGGESWQAGTWQNIVWEASNSDSFNLYYTTKEAVGYQLITSGISGGSTSYPWLVPNTPTTEAKVRIQAIKESDIVTDESNAVFAITLATDFYVNASTGSNSYNGLTSEVSGSNGPWKTITWASTQAATSSTIHVAAGTYNTVLGESFPINITNQKLLSTISRQATIEENTDATSILNLVDYATLEGFCLKGNGTDKVINVSGSSVIIKNNIINASSYSDGIDTPFASNATIEANVIYSAGNNGIYNAWGEGLRVYKNEIRNCANQGIFILGNNNIIDRNTIVKNLNSIFIHTLSGNVAIKNNIVSNQPILNEDFTGSSNGIYYLGGTVSLSYNNVWKNDADYSGISAGATDISKFPGFVSPEANDYHLQASNAYWTNPCIGTGDGGVNIGCYDGSVDAGVPYRNESYVSGSGNDTTGDGTSEATAWRTLTKANQYTVSKINIGAGTYNAGAGESTFPRNFSINRYVKGADRNAVTIEAGASQNVIYLHRNSSIEGVTLKGASGTDIILVNGTNVIIKDNIINAANYIYGVYVFNKSNTTLEANVVLSADPFGVLLSSASNIRLYKNAIINCPSQGIYSLNSSNIVIDKNTVVKCSYGIGNENTSATIKNNIVASEVGGFSSTDTFGIGKSGGSVTSTYNNVYACDTNWSGTTSGEGDISRDAKFVDDTNNDLHLKYNSPCIDSGDPASSPDPDDTRADMGAYPYDQTTSATPCVYVISPNGGESMTGLDQYTITWSATDDGRAIDHIELYYSTDSGATYPYTIDNNTTNEGSYLWTVGNTPTTQARVRVIAVGSAGIDESDGDFVILQGDATPPTVEVISPNGGEKWKGGSSHDITFTCTDEFGIKPDSANFYYSTGEGMGWITINTGQATNAAYSWNPIPSISTTEVKVRVSVQDNANTTGSDESNAVFTIDSTPPTVNVIVPNGGEKWKGGVAYDITWTATDNFTLEANPITIEASFNSGSSYSNIVSNEANDGIYNWPTPSLNTNEAKVKVMAIDECGNLGSDESSANFIIDITPPGTSELITPPNSSTTNDATPYFNWNAATDNLSGIASYEIWIDSNVITQDATTSYTTPDAMSEEVPHNWKVRARDGAGWWGDYSDPPWSFTVDLTTPEVPGITLKDRTNGSTQYTNELTISVEASVITDSPAEMRMAQDAGFTDNDTNWIPYQNPTEYLLVTGEGLCRVYYKLRDAASNESTTRNNNITVDTIAPSVESITLKDITTGSTIESNELTVTVEATGVSAESVSMRIAQNSSFSVNSTGWITYISSTRYTFTAGDGLRTAYYQVRDAASNESNFRDASITINTQSPTCSAISLKDRKTGSTSYSSELTVTVEAQTVSGTPEGMRLAENSAFSQNDTGWIVFANPTEYTLTAGEGSRMVYFKMRDAISNESPAYSDNINVDLNAPTIEVITPNGGERLSGLSGTFNVQWNASDVVGLPPTPITLRYSTDSGVNWTAIAAGQPNTPPYSWTVPAVDSTNCRVSAEAEDFLGRKNSAMSAGDFIIDSTRPTITSITPTNGATSVSITAEVSVVFSEEMSREATQNAFELSASPGVAGSFNWSGNGKTMTFTPSAALSYNTTYNVKVQTSACDLAGNGLAEVFSASFLTEAQGDTEKPHIVIQRVDRDSKANTLKSGDYMNRRPRIKGIITDNLAVDRGSIKLYLDGAQVAPVITEISAGNFETDYMTTADLEDESVKTHSIKLEAKDTAGNLGEKEISELKVSYGSARVIGPVLSYPQTFKPKSGVPAKIAYNLTADSDVMIYLFDTSGQNAWTGKYFSGGEGGKAGYNEVPFYGISELARTYLGNGVYVYKLVLKGKIIGTGYIAIFE